MTRGASAKHVAANVEIEEDEARNDYHDELRDAHRDARDRLAEHDLERRSRTDAQSIPRRPGVFGEERERDQRDEEERGHHRLPGHDLFRTVCAAVSVLYERGLERGFEERHRDDREHHEDHDR